MSLTVLPPEVQLIMLDSLTNDYATLAAVIFVSRHLAHAALEKLRICRTLDLSTGSVDSIVDALTNLYEFAGNKVVAGPRSDFVSCGNEFGDLVIQHAARYKVLKLSFPDRRGHRHDDLQISPSDMVKFEVMMHALSGNGHYDQKLWRKAFAIRRADACIRLLFHTMRHITTLELGGSTACLPWSLDGRLTALRTLKLNGITSGQLSKLCRDLIARSSLITLEFSNVSITSKFIRLFPTPLAITKLRITESWASVNALSKIIKACNDLVIFDYSLSASKEGVKPHYDHYYHMGQMVTDLRRHRTTLKHLTIIKRISPYRQRCVHLGSLAAFTVLETLIVDQSSLTPHESTCNVSQAQENPPQNQFEVIMRLPPSLRTLTLYRCDDETITPSLDGVVRSMGLLDLLPGLRALNIVYAGPPQFDLVATIKQREQSLETDFRNRGVEIKFMRPNIPGR